jgi:hypothetical protein
MNGTEIWNSLCNILTLFFTIIPNVSQLCEQKQAALITLDNWIDNAYVMTMHSEVVKAILVSDIFMFLVTGYR